MSGSEGPAGLVERAARVLAGGPKHTRELADRVMGLRGNASAAASAVFTLLGRDSRFHVDSEGVWSLASDREMPGPPLSRLRFVVVDVETTGGSWARGHRLTEVACVPVEQGRCGEGFESLVDPGRPIPPRIQGLTGITDPMVAAAPAFEGIAQRVAHELRDRIFVAHNVHFDWGFVEQALLSATGEAPTPPLLCTIRLGRFLVPGLRSYGLDSLTRHFGIRVHRRHRAFGDALATARLLLHLLMEAESRGVADFRALQQALEKKKKRPSRRRASGRGRPAR